MVSQHWARPKETACNSWLSRRPFNGNDINPDVVRIPLIGPGQPASDGNEFLLFGRVDIGFGRGARAAWRGSSGFDFDDDVGLSVRREADKISLANGDVDIAFNDSVPSAAEHPARGPFTGWSERVARASSFGVLDSSPTHLALLVRLFL